MFDKQYRFSGIHAEKVKQLSGVFDGMSTAQIFKRNVDVYANAPLIGFLYGKRSEIDRTKNPETGEVYNQNVMGDRVMMSSLELTFNFQLIMLLDKEYEPDEEKRIDKAFRHPGQDPNDEVRFDEYVRGGIDVLYEKLIEGAREPEDYVNRLFDFIDEFQERFNTEFDGQATLNMCMV